MYFKSLRRLWLPGLVTAIGVALWLFVPLAAGGSRPAVRHAAQSGPCTPAPPLPFGLQMNTVTDRDLAKTVAMEKEVFNCQSPAGGPLTIRDVETFIELVEHSSSTGVTTVSRAVQIATCDKSLGSGTVKCFAKQLPLGGPIPNPLKGCQLANPQPVGTVQMNSATLSPSFVKTVKVEKEVFNCSGLIGDLYVFTELIEQRTGITYRQLPTVFDGVMCVKDPSTGTVRSCRQITTH